MAEVFSVGSSAEKSARRSLAYAAPFHDGLPIF